VAVVLDKGKLTSVLTKIDLIEHMAELGKAQAAVQPVV
jgi:hypothetical protein